MKNSIKALVVVALLAIAGMANAQSSSTANATANATIVCPVSIIDATTLGNLEFGTIVNGPSGGTATVSTTDVETFTGVGVVGYTGSVSHATPHAADFLIGGQAGFPISITATSIAPFMVGATLGSLTSSLGSSVTLTGTGCVSGTVLDIGGTITFPGTTTGNLVGNIQVVVSY